MTEVGRPTPLARWVARRLIWPWVRLLFRPSLRGLENLPKDSAYLLVSNHSAGLGLAELHSLAAILLGQTELRLAGFAHPVGFRVWPLSAIHRQLGSIPSTYEAAEHTLAEGVPILVFPGGDHETLRPFWQAGRVDFGGRKGFLRIAQRARIPIVPMGIAGSHWTTPILFRSKLLATILIVPRLLGTKRWALSLLGLLGALAIGLSPLAPVLRGILVWLWLGSPLVFVPILPATIRMRIGAPIAPQALFGGENEAPDFEAALSRVEAEVQACMRDPL
ncbi:MAG: 1-acyl-sn-glycerol-3-phosphate acyltransferase [Myxococcota bacterium]